MRIASRCCGRAHGRPARRLSLNFRDWKESGVRGHGRVHPSSSPAPPSGLGRRARQHREVGALQLLGTRRCWPGVRGADSSRGAKASSATACGSSGSPGPRHRRRRATTRRSGGARGRAADRGRAVARPGPNWQSGRRGADAHGRPADAAATIVGASRDGPIAARLRERTRERAPASHGSGARASSATTERRGRPGSVGRALTPRHVASPCSPARPREPRARRRREQARSPPGATERAAARPARRPPAWPAPRRAPRAGARLARTHRDAACCCPADRPPPVCTGAADVHGGRRDPARAGRAAAGPPEHQALAWPRSASRRRGGAGRDAALRGGADRARPERPAQIDLPNTYDNQKRRATEATRRLRARPARRRRRDRTTIGSPTTA